MFEVRGELEIIVPTDCLVSVTGAPCPASLDGRPLTMNQATPARAGSSVRVGSGRDGTFTYLAVGGSIHAPAVFGSCAADPLAGIGGDLTRQTSLPFTPGATLPFSSDVRWHGLFVETTSPLAARRRRIEVLPGPQFESFPSAPISMTSEPYVVSSRSNHVGKRLDGPRPAGRFESEITSRGVPTGALEVPPEGSLIVLQRGHPITAGYPIVAMVALLSQGDVAQAPPGSEVTLQFIDTPQAVARYRELTHALRQLQSRARAALAEYGR